MAGGHYPVQVDQQDWCRVYNHSSRFAGAISLRFLSFNDLEQDIKHINRMIRARHQKPQLLTVNIYRN